MAVWHFPWHTRCHPAQTADARWQPGVSRQPRPALFREHCGLRNNWSLRTTRTMMSILAMETIQSANALALQPIYGVHCIIGGGSEPRIKFGLSRNAMLGYSCVRSFPGHGRLPGSPGMSGMPSPERNVKTRARARVGSGDLTNAAPWLYSLGAPSIFLLFQDCG